MILVRPFTNVLPPPCYLTVRRKGGEHHGRNRTGDGVHRFRHRVPGRRCAARVRGERGPVRLHGRGGEQGKPPVLGGMAASRDRRGGGGGRDPPGGMKMPMRRDRGGSSGTPPIG